ncbi:MAG: helix-turn-helix domain-containing protein [Pseudonocardiaceae bacterium]
MSVGKTPPLLQQQLARELARLRSLAGLDQREIGKRINLSQPMVSRAERAEKLLPLPKVLAWGEVCGASQEVLDRLSALTEAAFTQVEAWRGLMPESPQLQDAVRANEATTRTLLYYSSTVIPGLLQTPAYAEHVLRLTNYTGHEDEAAALAGRWRRQEALSDRTRHFGFLLPEAVLRWPPACSREVLATQLDRVATVAEQVNVSLGVVPEGKEPVLPFHGFTIYADRGEDDPFVAVELVHTYVTVNHPADVALYRDIYHRLASAAVTGPDAVALMQRMTTRLRNGEEHR